MISRLMDASTFSSLNMALYFFLKKRLPDVPEYSEMRHEYENVTLIY